MTESPDQYRRVLLKLSGEALMGDLDYGIEPVVIQRMAAEIATVSVGAETKPGVVVFLAGYLLAFEVNKEARPIDLALHVRLGKQPFAGLLDSRVDGAADAEMRTVPFLPLV